MVGDGVVNRADEGQVMGLAGQEGKVLAERQAGHGRGDRLGTRRGSRPGRRASCPRGPGVPGRLRGRTRSTTSRSFLHRSRSPRRAVPAGQGRAVPPRRPVSRSRRLRPSQRRRLPPVIRSIEPKPSAPVDLTPFMVIGEAATDNHSSWCRSPPSARLRHYAGYRQRSDISDIDSR